MIIFAKILLLSAAWLFAGSVGAACQRIVSGKKLEDKPGFLWIFWFSFIFIFVGGFL